MKVTLVQLHVLAFIHTCFYIFLDRTWEFARTTVGGSVAFRLQTHAEFWRSTIQPPQFITNIVEHGYKIQFTSEPPPFVAKNNRSSLENQEFVGEALEALERDHCIRQISSQPYCCNPLTVACGSTKQRLVLDLRHVNQFVYLQHFKYEDLSTFVEIFERGDYFGTFDLKSGYHHVHIHPSCTKYLGFKWVFAHGQEQFYEFLVLPFGLNSAGYIFTKVLRPLVTKWRAQGIKIILYIDDGVAGGGSSTRAAHTAQLIRQDLQSAGFLLNEGKTDLRPKQHGKWLGLEIDTKKMEFRVPPEKITKLKDQLRIICSTHKVRVKSLASLAGTLSALHFAIGPLVRLHTRAMYSAIAGAKTWYSHITLDAKALAEIRFWQHHYNFTLGYSFKPRPITAKMLFTDASDNGYGGFLIKREGHEVAAGKFGYHDMAQSSTHRELAAVKYALQSLVSLLANESITVFTDNFAASRILAVGSSKKPLQTLALDIFVICLHNNIRLLPQWVPREMNSIADFYSKASDTDDWSIDSHSFVKLNRKYGPFTIDRFADNLNKKTPRFNSKFFCPGTNGVDAFTEDWRGENNWICPPVTLIGSVFRHLTRCKATATVIVPVWRSAYFWPLLYPDGIRMANFVTEFFVFRPYFVAGENNTVFVGRTKFSMLALYCRH